MEAIKAPIDGSSERALDAMKAVSDLDELVQAVVKVTPGSKLWQRQMLAHLREFDRCVQVLRMTVSFDRGVHEVADAAASIGRVLEKANAYVAAGLADIGTKAALRLALDLSIKIDRPFSP